MTFSDDIWHYIILTANGLVTASSIFPISSGVLGVIAPTIMDTNRKDKQTPIFNLWIILGIIIIIIASLGWYSVLKKIKSLILLYVYALSIVCFVIIGIGFIYFDGHKRTRGNSLYLSLQFSYDKYRWNPEDRLFLDNLHNNLKCCGVIHPIEFDDFYPLSCCKTLENQTCITPYTKGCLKRYTKLIKNKNLCIGMLALMIGTVDMIAVHLILYFTTMVL